MSDLDDRLRDLDHVRAPDVWEDARTRTPGPAPADGSPWRRIGVAALALLVAVGAIVFAARAFLGSGRENRVGSPGYIHAAVTCDGDWRTVAAENPSPDGNLLLDVAATSDGSLWAVGGAGDGENYLSARTLIERWDGERWSVVSSPNVGSTANELESVSALGPDDIWAAGFYSDGGVTKALVEHWDGSRWIVVPTPDLTDTDERVYSIKAIAPDDVWAVGATGEVDRAAGDALILHWDGRTWRTQEIANLTASPSLLFDVDASSSTDAWAVGYKGPRWGGPPLPALVAHWNGTRWSSVDVSESGGGFSTGHAVAARAEDDVWVVGPPVVHWDGTEWAVVPIASGAGETTGSSLDLRGVVATGSDEAWAVGFVMGSREGEANRWASMRLPGGTAASADVHDDGQLTSVTVAPDGTLWAVGFWDTFEGRETLVVRC